MHLKIKVTPRAKASEFVERMKDETIKIRLKAVPEHGKANEELIRYLAQTLNLDKTRIEIVSGFSEPRKLVKIPDLTPLPW